MAIKSKHAFWDTCLVSQITQNIVTLVFLLSHEKESQFASWVDVSTDNNAGASTEASPRSEYIFLVSSETCVKAQCMLKDCFSFLFY